MYMGSLVREQLRLARRTLLLLVGTVAVLPLLFVLVPATASASVLGVPLPWLLPGVLVYPWLVLLGWRHVRRAERNERDFAELIGEASR